MNIGNIEDVKKVLTDLNEQQIEYISVAYLYYEKDCIP